MGYYTKYKLDVIQGKDKSIDYVAEIGEISGYGDEWENEEIKWYDHYEHMIEYSKKYPDTVFELTGYGEEQDDIWCDFYKDGKVQKTKAKIVFEDFNPLKLKEYGSY